MEQQQKEDIYRTLIDIANSNIRGNHHDFKGMYK